MYDDWGQPEVGIGKVCGRKLQRGSQPSREAAGITETIPTATAKPPNPVDSGRSSIWKGSERRAWGSRDGQDGVAGAWYMWFTPPLPPLLLKARPRRWSKCCGIFLGSVILSRGGKKARTPERRVTSLVDGLRKLLSAACTGGNLSCDQNTSGPGLTTPQESLWRHCELTALIKSVTYYSAFGLRIPEFPLSDSQPTGPPRNPVLSMVQTSWQAYYVFTVKLLMLYF